MNVNRNLVASVLRVSCLGLSLAAALLPLAYPFSAVAQTTNNQGRPDFSTFKLVLDRNIFDPRRSPRYVRSTRTETRRAAKPEFVALVGIMDYDSKGPIAFFDGTSSQYQKVLKPADTIAGYKVTQIGPSYVKLAVGTNEFRLPLGMQLRRDGEGKWQLAEPTESTPDRSERPSVARGAPQPPARSPGPPPPVTNVEPPTVGADAEPPPMPPEAQFENAAPNGAPEPPPGGGETDPVLLRLMQRRAQEAGQ
jgi:hypothetical protein